MAAESPMYQSAMELLGHSLSHYNGEKELDRKLVILHLANAVELILKDLLLDVGESIYKGPKETVSIHHSISALEAKGIVIPLRNKIELLIDERNSLQHRFGSPNEVTKIFYMNIAREFFSEVLKRHYGVEYEEAIAPFVEEGTLAAYRLSWPSNDKELEKLKELAKLHPLGALLSAWSYYDRLTNDFMARAGLNFRSRPFAMEFSTGGLAKYGIEPPEPILQALNQARRIRNKAVHGGDAPDRQSVIDTITTIEELEKYLNSVDVDAVHNAARVDREQYELRRDAWRCERDTEKEKARDYERLRFQQFLDLANDGPRGAD